MFSVNYKPASAGTAALDGATADAIGRHGMQALAEVVARLSGKPASVVVYSPSRYHNNTVQRAGVPNDATPAFAVALDKFLSAPLPETFPYTPETCPTKHYNRGDDICADCGEDLNPPPPPSIYIVQAEHFKVPGVVIHAHATLASATAEAVELVNIMLKDSGYKRRTSPTLWENDVLALQDEHGAAHCYVEIIETPLEGAP